MSEEQIVDRKANAEYVLYRRHLNCIFQFTTYTQEGGGKAGASGGGEGNAEEMRKEELVEVWRRIAAVAK